MQDYPYKNIAIRCDTKKQKRYVLHFFLREFNLDVKPFESDFKVYPSIIEVFDKHINIWECWEPKCPIFSYKDAVSNWFFWDFLKNTQIGRKYVILCTTHDWCRICEENKVKWFTIRDFLYDRRLGHSKYMHSKENLDWLIQISFKDAKEKWLLKIHVENTGRKVKKINWEKVSIKFLDEIPTPWKDMIEYLKWEMIVRPENQKKYKTKQTVIAYNNGIERSIQMIASCFSQLKEVESSRKSGEFKACTTVDEIVDKVMDQVEPLIYPKLTKIMIKKILKNTLSGK